MSVPLIPRYVTVQFVPTVPRFPGLSLSSAQTEELTAILRRKPVFEVVPKETLVPNPYAVFVIDGRKYGWCGKYVAMDAGSWRRAIWFDPKFDAMNEILKRHQWELTHDVAVKVLDILNPVHTGRYRSILLSADDPNSGKSLDLMVAGPELTGREHDKWNVTYVAVSASKMKLVWKDVDDLPVRVGSNGHAWATIILNSASPEALTVRLSRLRPTTAPSADPGRRSLRSLCPGVDITRRCLQCEQAH